MEYVILFLICAFVSIPGVLVGSVSFITIPLLIAFGIAPHQAVATNKLPILVMGLTGFITRRKEVLPLGRKEVFYGLLMFGGGILGAAILKWIPPLWVEVIIFSLALLAALPIPTPNIRLKKQSMSIRSFLEPFSLTLLAIYNGILGPGTMTLIISTFRFRGERELHMSIGLGNFLAGVGNVGAFLWFVHLGWVSWLAALSMMMGTFLGARIGTKVSHKVPEKLLEWTLRVVILVLVVVWIAKKIISI